MKRNKTPWGNISILIGVVIGILALTRGSLQKGLLIMTFSMWIFFSVLPYIKQACSIKRRKCIKKIQSEGIAPVTRFEIPNRENKSMELLLIHVNHRISAYLKAAYPEIRWEWCEKNPEKLICEGGVGRIRIFNVPDFDHADIKVDRKGNITCDMIRIVPLANINDDRNDSKNVPPNPIDPQIWYELQGREVLENLIADLNSRGHTHLILHEDGDIYVEEENNVAVSKQHLPNFPAKIYWERLVRVFKSNGLVAKIQTNSIQISW